MSAMTKPARALLTLAALFALYALAIRPRFRLWGVEPEEARRPVPGDGDVADANYHTTMAVRIYAAAEDVWPWLVQMGRGRGGLYSYDWLDRLFGFLDRPSAQEVLPEYQHLEPGEVIPIGHGGFPVKDVAQNQYLLLEDDASDPMWSWYLGLHESADGATELFSRNHGRFHGAGSRLVEAWLEPAAFIMTRKMLLNLKERAER